ncbi:hypothetical protein HOLleu_00499 [Holothuria leucospilota]|uniref:DUF4371 domain-containing protein n=1 Tax=Holothuria leucospilota TaxID=206669 RepID=A0A9Q1HJQ0_HOLLE|nr:hypothetical protein HOLleu_00499 [Holothuria leucospilota]
MGNTVAESFTCSRTKTAAIVNCLGDHFFEKLKTDMQNQLYSLMLDASNDTGLQKMFPVTVRIYDINFRRIMTKFLDINLLEGRDASTAETMFASVNNLLDMNDIQWDHCMAIGLDNTKGNVGEHQEFCDMEYAEVVQFISTRWLPLELCINRELKKYAGLRTYFLSENFCDARFKRLYNVYSNPMTEVYLLFYQAVLPCFTTFNKLLQKEEPLIHQLYDAQQRFMNKLAANLIHRSYSSTRSQVEWEVIC